VQNGNWSNPSTWSTGKVPAAFDTVWIPNGLSVSVDTTEVNPVRAILDNGLLQFATNVNTSLNVDTLVVGTDNNPTGVPEGTLTIGTAANPVQYGVTAKLTFTNTGAFAPLNPLFPNDTDQMSRGLISMGTVSIYGSKVTPYVALAKNANAGDTMLTLAAVPIGWSVGDTLLLPGTNAATNQDEQPTIAAINGNMVTLSAPLLYSHTAPAGQSVQVADEDRTVVLQSQTPGPKTGGHVMLMHTDQEVVAYADFLGLGRTDKSVPLNSLTNHVGRYALHFHRDYWPSLSGNDPPILVLGNYEEGSPGWGYDNHSSNVDFEYNVAFNNFGAGFATEAGNEIGTFNGNLAVRTIGVPNGAVYAVVNSRNQLQDRGFNGVGFWMQSPGCALTNNIATEDQVGFDYFNQGLIETGLGRAHFWTASTINPAAYQAIFGPLCPVDAVVLRKFSGNTASVVTDGLQIDWNGDPSIPTPAGLRSVVDHFTAWNVTDGIVIGYAGKITIQNSSLTANPFAKKLFAIGPIGIQNLGGYSNNVDVSNSNVTGFAVGEWMPSGGQNHTTRGYWDNTTNFEMDPDSNDIISFAGPITFGPHSVVNYELAPRLVGENPNGNFFPYQILLPDGQQLYYANQAANYVPYPVGTRKPAPAAFIGLTNQQLWNQFGLAMGGAVAPVNASYYAGSNGLAGDVTPLTGYYKLVSPPRQSAAKPYTLKYQLYNPDGTIGKLIVDSTPVTLQLGWNAVTRVINGVKHTWLVLGT
jgi:hypothetical protein